MKLAQSKIITIVIGLTFILLASVATAADLPSFTELVKKNNLAVVNISTRRIEKNSEVKIPPQFQDLPQDWLRFFFNLPDNNKSKPQPHSLGSGFIVKSNGYIVTNHHVIDGADEVTVRFNDMRSMKAKIIGSDPRTDLALIKVEGKKLPTVVFGNSDNLEVGAWVIAIGSPFGFDYSVTSGIVSAKGRSLPNDAYVPFLQTDVAINPGNSGGPLFNLSGKVVGVNSQIYSRSGGFMGLSFAIPSNLTQFVIKQLKENGKVARGFFGVTVQEITSELSETFNMKFPHGALVSSIIPNSSAEKAGIKVGDVITHFNSQLIRRSYELPPIVGTTALNKRVPVIVQRNGRTKTLFAKVTQLDEKGLEKASRNTEKTKKFPRLGLIAKELNSNLRSQINTGVLVTQVEPNGATDRASIQPGDVILSIQSSEIQSLRDVSKVLRRIKNNRHVRVLFWRKGLTSFTTLFLER